MDGVRRQNPDDTPVAVDIPSCKISESIPSSFPGSSSSSHPQPPDRTSLPSRVEVDAYESSGTLEQGMTSRVTKHQERRSSTTWDDATDPLACEGQWGNLEYRVHGNNSFRNAISPTPFHPLDDMERKLTSYVDDIEKSIVLPGYTQGSISVYLPNKLDRFLVAAENLTRILRHPVMAEREDLHDRVRCLHSTTMSALATEFCHLRIWRSAAGPISNESVRCSNDDCSVSSMVSWSSSSSFTRSSTYGFSNDGQPEKILVNYMRSIDTKSVYLMDAIARVMTDGGCEQVLRAAFDRHHTELVRRSEIPDIENILGSHMNESVEMLVNGWVSAMRIIINVLTNMQRQLLEQNFGAFNSFKDDYFMVIATKSIMKLLAFGSSLICNWKNADKDNLLTSGAETTLVMQMILKLVIMYRALKDEMPVLLLLFLGQTEHTVLVEFGRLIDRSSALVLDLFVDLNNFVKSQRLVMDDVGVHRVTRHTMDYIGSLVEQKDTIYLMLEGSPNAFVELVTQLISALEFMLVMNSRTLTLQGQQQLFLLNNVHFMLEQAKKFNDLGLILGQSWLIQRQEQLTQLITGYMEDSWEPVMSSLFEKKTLVSVILWSNHLFDEFISSLDKIYSMQTTWKVSDPLIRQKLREAIIQKVIPLFRQQLEKKHKPSYDRVEHLESQLLEMFEG